MSRTISSIKAALIAQLDEWLGIDLPDEGTEDYDIWQCRRAAIEQVSSVDEAKEYLAGIGMDDEAVHEFLEAIEGH